MSQWEPIAPSVVAALLAAQNKRLLRSNRDAVDGIVEAVEAYSLRLKSESPGEIDDLWNQPKGSVPSPKDEERVSDKVCVAVRSYFREYAVAAHREVQVFRRKLARELGGAAGSEVDVLCDVPAVGSVQGEPIRVPIEVKLAHNPEARTGLRDQLVERYMKEVGTSLGVYVVVWMGGSNAAARYRPLWRSPDEARAELEEQARALIAASADPRDIRCIVIDASLLLEAKRVVSVTKARQRKSGRAKSRRATGRVRAPNTTKRNPLQRRTPARQAKRTVRSKVARATQKKKKK